jgi:hypothetical protein
MMQLTWGEQRERLRFMQKGDVREKIYWGKDASITMINMQ